MNMMFRQVACFLVASFLAFTVEARTAQVVTGEVEAGRTKAVFSVSWLPGFCQTRPERPECKAQTPVSFDATHLTLHGLWPVGKSYCGVDDALKAQDRRGKWLDLPRTELAEGERVSLAAAMPGVQSGLDRHQWVRSGRCHSQTAGAYFEMQLRYLAVLNNSPVRSLFIDRLGQEIKEQEVRKAFDLAFGRGAGERVRLQCRKVGETTIVTGLTIGLGDSASNLLTKTVSGAAERAVEGAEDDAGLSALILAADAISGKCSSGLIERVEGR
jgi:ribonuclease T2